MGLSPSEARATDPAGGTRQRKCVPAVILWAGRTETGSATITKSQGSSETGKENRKRKGLVRSHPYARTQLTPQHLLEGVVLKLTFTSNKPASSLTREVRYAVDREGEGLEGGGRRAPPTCLGHLRGKGSP